MDKVFQYEINGTVWKVEKFFHLAGQFGVKESQLPQFHAVAEKYEFPWGSIRRIFGIIPLNASLDSDAKYLRTWTRMDVAIDLELTEEELESQLEIVKVAWQKWFRDNSGQQIFDPPVSKKKKAVAPPIPPPTPPPQVTTGKDGKPVLEPMVDDDKRALLLKYGFTDTIFAGADSIEDARAEREWLVHRIRQTERVLEEPSVSHLAYGCLKDELFIERIDRKMFSQDVLGLGFRDLQDTKNKLAKQHLEKWTKITEQCTWANEVERKFMAAGVFSDMGSGLQEFYSDKTHHRIFGLKTAFGMQVALRCAEQHGIRFRLGQQVAVLEAQQPGALWSRDWKRTMSDDLCQCADEGFREGFERMRKKLGIPLTDLESDSATRGEYIPIFEPPPEVLAQLQEYVEPPDSVAIQ